MNVTCKKCGVESSLNDSNSDKANWLGVTDRQVVIDDVEGSVLRDIVVGYKLQWLCDSCENLNEIFDAVAKETAPVSDPTDV